MALELAPNSLTYDNLGLLLYSRGNYAEATDMFQQAIILRPADHLLRSHLADALWADDKPAAAHENYLHARALARDALKVNPNDAFTKMDLAWISAALGEFDEALTLVAEAASAAPNDPFVHYTEALIHSRRGAKDEAFLELQSAVELGYSSLLLQHDPNFADLHGDQRWKDLTGDGN